MEEEKGEERSKPNRLLFHPRRATRRRTGPGSPPGRTAHRPGRTGPLPRRRISSRAISSGDEQDDDLPVKLCKAGTIWRGGASRGAASPSWSFRRRPGAACRSGVGRRFCAMPRAADRHLGVGEPQGAQAADGDRGRRGGVPEGQVAEGGQAEAPVGLSSLPALPSRKRPGRSSRGGAWRAQSSEERPRQIGRPICPGDQGAGGALAQERGGGGEGELPQERDHQGRELAGRPDQGFPEAGG